MNYQKTVFILVFVFLLSCSLDDTTNNKLNDNDFIIEQNDEDLNQDSDLDTDDEPEEDIVVCPCDDVEGDEDGDGIPNSIEGCDNTDWDNLPDCMDDDSDGDGISDREECPSLPCKDTDNDGAPDYLDRDSDGDCYTDSYEEENGLNPYDPDSDGDGMNDAEELFMRTDPLDSSSFYDDAKYVYLCKETQTEKISFSFKVLPMDVVVLIDVTASTEKTLPKVREEIKSFINEDFAEITNNSNNSFGIVEIPYNVVLPVTSDVELFNQKISDVKNRGDNFELTAETMYQVVTGKGLVNRVAVASGLFGGEVLPESIEDVAFPAKNCVNKLGNIGGACLRKEAVPMFLVITDEVIEEVKLAKDVESSEEFATIWLDDESPGHTIKETLSAMNSLGAKFIGINSEFKCDDNGENCQTKDTADESLARFALETGTTNQDLKNYNFHTDDEFGNGIKEKLKSAIAAFVTDNNIKKNITISVEQIMDKDPYEFSEKTLKYDGYEIAALSAEPAENVEKIEGKTFYGAKPETELNYEMTFKFPFFGGGAHKLNFLITFKSGEQVIGAQKLSLLLIGGE